MAVIPSGNPSARRGSLAAFLASVSRNELFAGVYILGCANGLLGRFAGMEVNNWLGLVQALDINVIVVFACFAGLAAILHEQPEDIRQGDILASVVCLGFAALPIPELSWVGVTALSIYILLFANDGSERKRGAIILLALTVPMLWSRLLFHFFAKYLLDIDAWLVASLLGTERVGNMVGFAQGSGHIVVLPACASLANMSLAFLTWVAVTQWAKHRWVPSDIFWSLLVCGSVVAVNVTRMTLMGLSYWHYELIHKQFGDMVWNSIMLGLMVGFSLLGVRRELFSRP
jgi:hypothetical protein